MSKEQFPTPSDHEQPLDKFALGDKLESVIDYLSVARTPDVRMATTDETFMIAPHESAMPEPLTVKSSLTLHGDFLDGSVVYRHSDGNVESLQRLGDRNRWHFVAPDRTLQELPADDASMLEYFRQQQPFAEQLDTPDVNDDLQTAYRALQTVLRHSAGEWGEKREFRHVSYHTDDNGDRMADQLTTVGIVETDEGTFSHQYLDVLSVEDDKLVSRRLVRNATATTVDLNDADYEQTNWRALRSNDLTRMNDALDRISRESTT